MLLGALISGHRVVASACNFELASSSQISADDFVKLSDVMGPLEIVQKGVCEADK